MSTKSAKPVFSWEDPLLLTQQLSSEERMIMEAARDYAQGQLAPRILHAFRNEWAALAYSAQPSPRNTVAQN